MPAILDFTIENTREMEWDNIGWLYLILDFTIENTREMEWDNIGWFYST